MAMNFSLDAVQHAYARLAPRERVFVVAAGIALGATLLFGIVYQLSAAKTSLRDRIHGKERQIEEIQRVRDSYLKLRASLDAVTSRDPQHNTNWLYSTLDSLVSKTVSRDKISKMSPASKPIGDQYVEDSVDIVLSSVTLEQVVALLVEVENQEAPLSVSRLDLKKRVADPYQFDVTLTVASLRAASAAATS
jgi:hypothetical protein